MRRVLALVAVVAPVAVALLTPVAATVEVPWSPVQAAYRTESQVAPLGLSWGRLRGWQRVGDGWLLTWQPAHGAWMVRTWAPDGGDAPAWRLEVAPWLPGARPSRGAAALLLDAPDAVGTAEDRLGRRDWRLGDQRLLGTLPGGGRLPTAPELRLGGWEALLAGLLLAGTVARVVFPALPVRLSRRTVSWLTVAVILLLPWMTPLGGPAFQVGVRPWVTELVLWTSAALILGASIFAVVSFPAAYQRPSAVPLAVALGVGLLAGRLGPGTWPADIEGLTVRAVPLVAIVVVGGWFAALAADGLRLLLGGTMRWRRWVLAVLACAAVASAGDSTGVVLAVLIAAAQERAQGVWTAGFVLWGWLVGAVIAVCTWPSATWDAATALAVAGLALALSLVVDLRPDRAQLGSVTG